MVGRYESPANQRREDHEIEIEASRESSPENPHDTFDAGGGRKEVVGKIYGISTIRNQTKKE